MNDTIISTFFYAINVINSKYCYIINIPLEFDTIFYSAVFNNIIINVRKENISVKINSK